MLGRAQSVKKRLNMCIIIIYEVVVEVDVLLNNSTFMMVGVAGCI
jgi:hypothetical protein